MKQHALALAAAFIAAPAAAEPHLVLRLIADEHVIQPGESVHWQLWAELFEPDGEILATVAEIDFSLTFGGIPSLSIADNNFAPAFDSTFFGPADDGIVSGDSIANAIGTNTLPPLNNPGGPDSSNPLLIYSFTMVHDGFGGGEKYTPQLTINGVFTGAYVGSPFPTIFFYQLSSVPFPVPVPFSVQADTVYNIPTPATGTLALLSLTALRRRRSR